MASLNESNINDNQSVIELDENVIINDNDNHNNNVNDNGDVDDNGNGNEDETIIMTDNFNDSFVFWGKITDDEIRIMGYIVDDDDDVNQSGLNV